MTVPNECAVHSEPGSHDLPAGIPDHLWGVVEPLLPSRVAPELGGRPRADDRAVFTTVLFVVATGCSWRTADRLFGVAKSTAHRRLREWTSTGLWPRLHQAALDCLGRQGLDDWVRRASAATGMVRRGNTWRRRET